MSQKCSFSEKGATQYVLSKETELIKTFCFKNVLYFGKRQKKMALFQTLCCCLKNRVYFFLFDFDFFIKEGDLKCLKMEWKNPGIVLTKTFWHTRYVFYCFVNAFFNHRQRQPYLSPTRTKEDPAFDFLVTINFTMPAQSFQFFFCHF